MGVGQDLVHLVLLRVVVAPDLGEAHEEQLLRSQFEILHREDVLVLTGITEICLVCCLQSPIVSNILPQSASKYDRLLRSRSRSYRSPSVMLPSIDILASQGEVAILLHQALRVFLVLSQGLLRPPGLQVSGSVVPPAVIIEGVAELVADGEADPPVVEDCRPPGFVEWLLEDTQGEDDLVHQGRVVSIDGLR